jgi:hypothetical protein
MGVTGLSSPVVGRDRELAALGLPGSLRRGRGQVVSIVAKPGSGSLA